jgi:eukaryotic-like serine/threonine-protein kinase
LLQAEILRTVGSAYREIGGMDMTRKAIELYSRSVELVRQHHVLDHRDTLTIMNGLGACYWSLKQLDKSVALFKELLPRLEKKLGRDHPNTLMVLANLGVNYKDAGRLAEAIPLLEEAYRESKKFPILRWVGASLLDTYAKAGKSAESRNLIGEVLADARKTLPKDSPELAGMMALFSMSLMEMKGYAEASLLRECLAIREKTQPDAWARFNTMSMLGGALLGQKQFTDAETLLLKGYEGLKAREAMIPEQGKVRLLEGLDRLIELYAATDKPNENEKWQAERAKYLPAAINNK